MSETVLSSNRQAYLNEVWGPQANLMANSMAYPAAHAQSQPLDSLLREKPFVTRGRLVQLGSDSFQLRSNNVQKSFQVRGDLHLAPGFSWAQCLALNDILEVEGESVGDTLQVKSVRLLVPSRHSNPFGPSSFDVQRSRQWQDFVGLIRDFFKNQNFIELRTPTLVSSPGLEPHLDPFETVFQWGRQSLNYYLPTSPEFHLKKALTQGFEKCFEFKECFRNGELSEHHQPEFLMLEWYRAYQDNQALMVDLQNLLKLIQEKVGAANVHPVSIILMEDLWRQHLDFNLTPQTTVSELKAVAQRTKVEFHPDENFDDVFARIFLERLEPALAKLSEPVILYHFPPSQAALSRLTKDGWADRFELYWRGLEIANAFHELNDVDEQRRRFLADQEKKRQLGKKVVPLDEEFMKALEWGMPPAAGIALGVERLFMALYQIKTLDEVRLFPMKR